MISVGIVGGTGYTGVELLRLLVDHPDVTIDAVTSRSAQGQRVADVYPSLRGRVDLPFTEPEVGELAQCDLVFFATPNGTAMGMAPALLHEGVRIIDLAADFRLKDQDDWRQWYGVEHACPELLEEAVYGLPELHRERIATARLVANPGCYPTAIQLGFLPLIETGVVDSTRLIADAKSGVSGAGRAAQVAHLLCECSESLKAYALGGHRHLPEISQGLAALATSEIRLTFVPHLTPMIRGIHATLYAELTAEVDPQRLFEQRFKGEPFIDVMPAGSHPETRSVRGSNLCRIAVHQPGGGNRLVVLSVIDNLVKGAAGQAIQNMNIMLGWEETRGLGAVPLTP
jgi:N-acetyl-gamma-glutamyl-phosphate reductase